MKIRALASNTFHGLLRNRLIVLFCAIFLCVILLMLSPILMMKASQTKTSGQITSLVESMLWGIETLLSGFGSLLAAWAAADSVAGEIDSGTILAVLARPVRRWEFLLGKYLGVLMLMAVYVVCMFGMGYLLAAVGGQRIHSSPLPMLLYPMVRYAVYAAIAILFATRLHPIFAFALTLVLSILASLVGPDGGAEWMPKLMAHALYVVLPSTGLLTETRFLTLTQAATKSTPWTEHATTLAYGLDYAAMCFLAAVWAFRRRSLTRE